MSYIIDVYREEVKPQKSIINLGLYIMLFPQLIAGPIVRYIDIEEQINTREVNLYKDRKSTRLNSSHANISYAVFCLKKKITFLSRHSTTCFTISFANARSCLKSASSSRPVDTYARQSATSPIGTPSSTFTCSCPPSR